MDFTVAIRKERDNRDRMTQKLFAKSHKDLPYPLPYVRRSRNQTLRYLAPCRPCLFIYLCLFRGFVAMIPVHLSKESLIRATL